MGHQIYKFKTIVRMWGNEKLSTLYVTSSWVSTKKKKNPLDTLLLHVEIEKKVAILKAQTFLISPTLFANEIQLSPLHLFQAAYKNPSWYVTINQNPNHTWSHPPPCDWYKKWASLSTCWSANNALIIFGKKIDKKKL